MTDKDSALAQPVAAVGDELEEFIAWWLREGKNDPSVDVHSIFAARAGWNARKVLRAAQPDEALLKAFGHYVADCVAMILTPTDKRGACNEAQMMQMLAAFLASQQQVK